MSQARNVVIVGAGIGEKHLAGYQELPERYSVSAVCDINIDRAKAVVGDNPEIDIMSDFDKVLHRRDIDLVDICLPPHLHLDASIAALEAGKHVICEKPLVSSLRDADRLADKARQCGKVLSPVFQYRYGPATAQLKALMRAGLTGRPLVANIETHWNRGDDYYAVPWRGTWKGEQGGAVLGHAIHNHDLLCAIFGPVETLSALTTTRVNDIEVEDCAAISFQMTNGALASSSITLGAADDTSRLKFCFENLMAVSGSLPYAPAEDTWTFTARGSTSQSQIDDCLAHVDAGDSPKAGFAGFFEALADKLDGIAENHVSIEDGRRSLELVSAIYHAARTKQTVSLPLSSDSPVYNGWLP